MFKIKRLKKYSTKVLREINYLTAQMSLTKTPPQPLTSKIFKELLAQKNVYFFVALARPKGTEKIIGILSIYFVRIPTGLICWAEDLLVDKLYHKWGVGRLLMEEGVELAHQKRARHINLRTNPKRIEANKLYQQMGFKRMKTNFYRINLYK